MRNGRPQGCPYKRLIKICRAVCLHFAVEIEQKTYIHCVGERIAFPFLFNHKALFYFVGQGFYSCRKLIFLKTFISYIPLSCHKGIKRHSRGNPLKNPKALCLKTDREPTLYCKGHNAVLFYKPL